MIDFKKRIKAKGISIAFIAKGIGVSKFHLHNMMSSKRKMNKELENDLRRILDIPVETEFNDFHGTTILEGDTLEYEGKEYVVCWNKKNKVWYLESDVLDGVLFLSEQCGKMKVNEKRNL